MAQIAAIGDGAIVYVEDGKQVSLPLSDIYFDGGTVGSLSDTSTKLAAWLKYLARQGRLVPGPTPAPGPAMTFTAVGAGSNGNNIVVTVTKNGASKVDIQVTETDIYDDMTLDSTSSNYLQKVLGISGDPGTRPGLVRVEPITGTPSDPEPLPPTSATPPWDVADAAGATSFTLKPRGAGSDRAQAPHQPKWIIEISNVVQPAAGRKTFTLKVVWTNAVTVEASDLSVDPDDTNSELKPLAFAVAITKPDGATELKLPKPGSATLRGGDEPTQATKAKATLLANA